jgi:hypothetical protein
MLDLHKEVTGEYSEAIFLEPIKRCISNAGELSIVLAQIMV